MAIYPIFFSQHLFTSKGLFTFSNASVQSMRAAHRLESCVCVWVHVQTLQTNKCMLVFLSNSTSVLQFIHLFYALAHPTVFSYCCFFFIYKYLSLCFFPNFSCISWLPLSVVFLLFLSICMHSPCTRYFKWDMFLRWTASASEEIRFQAAGFCECVYSQMYFKANFEPFQGKPRLSWLKRNQIITTSIPNLPNIAAIWKMWRP